MNWAILIPILVDIFRKILENRAKGPLPVGAASGDIPALMSDQEADALATKLEVACKPPAGATAEGPQPMAADGGMISQMMELIAALRAKDWAKVWQLLMGVSRPMGV